MVAEKYRHIKPTDFYETESQKQWKRGFYWGWFLAIGVITLFIAII